MGHIDLAAPVSHIWFFKGVPARIGYLIDMAPKELEKVLYFAASIVTWIDEEARTKDMDKLEKEVRKVLDGYSAGTMLHLEQAAGEFVLPTRRSRRSRPAPRHRRVRGDPGDRDAAQPLPVHRQRRAPPGPRPRRPTSWCCTSPERARLDFPARPGALDARARSASSPATTTCTACSTSPTSTRWCPTSPTGRRSRAARAGCSTRSRPTTTSRAGAADRAVPGRRAGGRRGRQGHVRGTGAEVEADGATADPRRRPRRQAS